MRTLDSSRKIRSRRWLATQLRRVHPRETRIVFANGCFDLLHPGHVRLLEQARRHGDLLVVGLNTDRSVRRLKGSGRPIVPQRDRARVIAALGCVDYVTFFDEATPYELIRAIQPDVLVKGADWATNHIIGRDVVRARGGRVVRIALERGHSTTSLIERIARQARR